MSIEIKKIKKNNILFLKKRKIIEYIEISYVFYLVSFIFFIVSIIDYIYDKDYMTVVWFIISVIFLALAITYNVTGFILKKRNKKLWERE